MMYCIVDNGVIVNIIMHDNSIATPFDAYPFYTDAKIGDKYDPPIPISQMDRLEAQTTYTAMMTGTLIGG